VTYEALDLGRGVQRSGAILAIPILSGLHHHSYNCPPLLVTLLLVSPSPKRSRLRLVLVSTVSRRSPVSWQRLRTHVGLHMMPFGPRAQTHQANSTASFARGRWV
jgi:hypothetical protein